MILASQKQETQRPKQTPAAAAAPVCLLIPELLARLARQYTYVWMDGWLHFPNSRFLTLDPSYYQWYVCYLAMAAVPFICQLVGYFAHTLYNSEKKKKEKEIEQVQEQLLLTRSTNPQWLYAYLSMYLTNTSRALRSMQLCTYQLAMHRLMLVRSSEITPVNAQ